MNAWVPAARMLHQIGVPYPYMNHIACASTSILTEIKFEVTDRCNLACTFCHQEFGAKGGTTDLDPAVYERVLDQAKKERIPVVRVTGGEPLVLKHIDDLLRRAKAMGFATIVNSNGTALTEKRLEVLKPLVDCVKISLPAADEATTTALTGDAKTWRRKWTALELLSKHGVNTHVLTVMTSQNIEAFERFLALLAPHAALVWKPLRAEPQDGRPWPVTRGKIRDLAARLALARKMPRWKALTLGLATPFCALKNPEDALEVFGGGHTCGPFASLTVTSTGDAVRCYSRRTPVDLSGGLRKAGRDLSQQDFEAMTPVCRNCPYAQRCRGGCRCEAALTDTPYGRMDYLADPSVIEGSQAFVVR
jgi:radical SAM protein with 4Fe4S-binding SPASM domain